MTNPVLKSIVKLFSLFSNIEADTDINKISQLLQFYLSSYIQKSSIDEFLNIFHFFNTQFLSEKDKNYFKNISLKSVKTLRTIDEINKELIYREKVYLYVHLVEILKHKTTISEDENDFLRTIAFAFNINEDEFIDLKAFILSSCYNVPNKGQILLISKQSPSPKQNIKFIEREHLDGSICFYYISSADMFIFYYNGSDTIFLNDQQIVPGKIFQFAKGNAISSYRMGLQNIKLKPIYYTELGMQFIPSGQIKHVKLFIDDINFKYAGSREGIHPFRFRSESFLFVGVIGSSGVGKSTLLNILNGNIVPDSGSVKINGYDIHKNKDLLKGLIGYVPQDDLLFEDLTVYQNLYYNAKLCFGDYSDEDIHQTIDSILNELDLYSVRNSKPGSAFDKTISGGQRKRVNIALELMREPSILFIDEPTSGLSSSDSRNIIKLLREQTLKGKLVIANVHQPSSEIYKLFDQLIVLDMGGYPVYTGDPMDGVVYFKTIDQQVDAHEKECPVCGNINPEVILDIIEEKEVDETGTYTEHRKIAPEKWYELYKDNIEAQKEFSDDRDELPEHRFHPPSFLKQLRLFFQRNLHTKLVNTQYLLISLLEAPLLAVILGYFTKYTAGNESEPLAYIFSQNVNVPSYLLMSIIVVLFLGMLVSAEEIINDRNVLEREKFLDLSRSSYLLSKISYLFLLSAIQVISFVIIGNAILEIKGMTLNYWMILFSTACFSNMLGLNISAGLKSQVAIYVLIPFLLIPQILLSGTIVKFDKFHGKLTSELYPPIIADLMPSRWAYEALAVTQFRDNVYEKHIFQIEQRESKYSFRINYYIPELLSILDECRTFLIKDEISEQENTKIIDHLLLLKNELNKVEKETSISPPVSLNDLTPASLSRKDISSLRNYLGKIRKMHAQKLDETLYKKDQVIDEYSQSSKNNLNWTELKSKYHNKALAELVKRKKNPEKMITKNHRLYRKFEPIYKIPALKSGRAEFYSPSKRIGADFYMNTVVFNIIIIWIFIVFLYILLYFNILEKSLDALSVRRKLKNNG
jgi:ABC-type multidrug transport system ATPase subunit